MAKRRKKVGRKQHAGNGRKKVGSSSKQKKRVTKKAVSIYRLLNTQYSLLNTKKSRKLRGKAKAIYAQLNQLYKLPPKKRRITKKAASIYRLLNTQYSLPTTKTGFAKNNFNYIRSLLWRHHKVDFKGYKDAGFLKTVKELYNDCKPLGADCTDEAILARYLKLKKAPTRPQPFIDPALFDPQPYFGIKDVEFAIMAPYLWIVSPMIIPSPHEFIITSYYYHYNKLLDAPPEEVAKFATEIAAKTNLSNLNRKEETQILDLVKKPTSSWSAQDRTEFLEIYAKHNEDATRGYNTYFKLWVDWCNDAMHAAYGGTPPSDKIFFKFTGAAEYNPDKERWEATLVICTAGGQLNDFGFKPSGQITETEVWQQYIEPAPDQLLPPTPAQLTEEQQEIAKQKAVANIESTLKELTDKAKKIDKKDKEHEIRIFLLEEERKAKELARLTKLSNQLRKSLTTLNKNLKLAQKMKDHKEAKRIYSKIKKLAAEIDKINEKLVKLGK